MKKEYIPRIILLTLFVIFIALYFTQATGYYEFQLAKKTELTEEQIQKFEEDIKAGKEVDIDAYLEENNKIYKNKVSNASFQISKQIEKTLKKGIESFFRMFESVAEE